MSIAAVSGLFIFLMSSWGEKRVFAGAASVLLTIVSVVALLPSIHIEAESGSLATHQIAAAPVRVRTRHNDFFETIELDEQFKFPNDEEYHALPLQLGGYGGVRFSLQESETLSISVRSLDVAKGDPFLQLYQELEKLGDNIAELVAEDDDGGRGVDAEITQELDAGDYLLFVRDISSDSGLHSQFSFGLQIKKYVPTERTVEPISLTHLGAPTATCSAEGANCEVRVGMTTVAGIAPESDRYELSILDSSPTGCLVLDVRPNNFGDTILNVFDGSGRTLFYDDDSGISVGSRLVVPTSSTAGSLYVGVGAYSAFVEYTLTAMVVSVGPDGQCVSADRVDIPDVSSRF